MTEALVQENQSSQWAAPAGNGVKLTTPGWVLFILLQPPQYSLLLLQLVGSCKLIEQLPIHLHESLEHIVDQRYDGSGIVKER